MDTREFFAKLGKHCLREKGCCKGCMFREFCSKTAAEQSQRRVEMAEQLLEAIESGVLKQFEEAQNQSAAFETAIAGSLGPDTIVAIVSGVKKAVESAIRGNSEEGSA